MRREEARSRFLRTTSRPDGEIDLAEAALLIAAEEYEELDLDAQLRRLDALAEQARVRIGDVSLDDAGEFIRRFHAFLFDELGFRGNDQDYYDPRNSFL
ncbi:MAG TPA: transglutaminase family protein, partial [bacterium]|nr:transglutaminase family protein [bacterium]